MLYPANECNFDRSKYCEKDNNLAFYIMKIVFVALNDLFSLIVIFLYSVIIGLKTKLYPSADGYLLP